MSEETVSTMTANIREVHRINVAEKISHEEILFVANPEHCSALLGLVPAVKRKVVDRICGCKGISAHSW